MMPAKTVALCMKFRNIQVKTNNEANLDRIKTENETLQMVTYYSYLGQCTSTSPSNKEIK